MASRGSVIPLFFDQIKAGKLLTLTAPDMTRFMMTLEDSVDLVLYAYEHGRNGDIFVQKAPNLTGKYERRTTNDEVLNDPTVSVTSSFF